MIGTYGFLHVIFRSQRIPEFVGRWVAADMCVWFFDRNTTINLYPSGGSALLSLLSIVLCAVFESEIRYFQNSFQMRQPADGGFRNLLVAFQHDHSMSALGGAVYLHGGNVNGFMA